MIPEHFYPFWTVYDSLGQKYCDCSHEEYAIRTLELHEGEEFTYRRIDAPKPLPPHIVDVTATAEKTNCLGNRDYLQQLRDYIMISERV
tara:strand:+ start:810 stop:1076 length:267 start_codon:yes stop_codon:yes gene_type:complete